MSAFEAPAVTAAVFIHHHQFRCIRQRDTERFATSSEQQQEYVQFFGDFPREKNPVPG